MKFHILSSMYVLVWSWDHKVPFGPTFIITYMCRSAKRLHKNEVGKHFEASTLLTSLRCPLFLIAPYAMHLADVMARFHQLCVCILASRQQQERVTFKPHTYICTYLRAWLVHVQRHFFVAPRGELWPPGANLAPRGYRCIRGVKLSPTD
jgi:hypothetical protein